MLQRTRERSCRKESWQIGSRGKTSDLGYACGPGPLTPDNPPGSGAATSAKAMCVLNYLSEEIRKCRLKAEDCARKAAAQTDLKLKKHLLNLEEHWLFLARTYAYHERHGRYGQK